MADICGVVSNCGPNREPLACGYRPDHGGPHAWATLPTWLSHAHDQCDDTCQTKLLQRAFDAAQTDGPGPISGDGA